MSGVSCWVRGCSSRARALGLLLSVAGGLHAQPECRACHAAIYDSFSKTGMGRSIQERPGPPDASFYHRLSNRHYTVAGGRMRRYQLGPQQREINVIEKTIDFAIGSGNHAVTYASRGAGNVLIELPLSWYRDLSGYAMSPQYDRSDHPDMRREISPACLFCHAAYPRETDRAPRSINCDRCHGPSDAHLKRPGRGTILNPARLSAERQLDVCLQCHLETTSVGIPDSLRKPGRGVFSFRPGEPLSDYKTYFDRADPPEPRFEVNHAGYRLIQSACFRASRGKMTCTTCHDPHTAQTRPACAMCHASAHARETADCAGCHMPKRRPSDAIHVTMTDHWISRKPQFRDPEREETKPYTGRVIPFYTPPDPMLTEIANLRDATPEAAAAYRRHLRRDPRDVAALAALANVLLRLGNRAEAIAAAQKALAIDPDHVGALNTLGVARASAGEHQSALALFERARAAHPEHALTWLNLGVTLAAMSRKQEAAAAYKEAIRLQPDFAEAKQRLAALEAGR